MPNFGADGKFFGETARAVHRFKEDRNISPTDGVVGPKTMGALDALFGPGPAPSVCPPCPETPRTPGCPPCPPTPGPIVCNKPTNPDHWSAADNPSTTPEPALKTEVKLSCVPIPSLLPPFFTPNPNFGECLMGREALKAHDEADAKANSLLDETSPWPGGSKLPGHHLGPDDCFRHCFASCILASRTNPAWAERVGTAHEISGPGGTAALDSHMDLHDNFMGRSFSKPGDGPHCEQACLDAARAGQLRTIRPVPGTKPPVFVCIGASDQPWP
jgi:hypothetical protein